MLKPKSFFWAAFALFALRAVAGAAAPCKVQDLTACLDSVCADGAEADPAERCYMCGTAAATKPKEAEYKLGGKTPGMQSLSLGKSSKNTLSDKELKAAPKDPGERYQWATKECLAKLKDCKTDDVEDNYDKLIKQSCEIALGEKEYAESMKKAGEKKTRDVCRAEINNCLLGVSKCGGDMMACKEDAEFNRNFSICAADATGCVDYMTELRGALIASRDDMVKKSKSRLTDLVALRQNERKERFERMNRSCQAAGKAACVAEICGNLPKGRNDGGACNDPNEKIWATNLCKFVDIACGKLK